ncbi:hypothetical protein J2T16_000541 [Paenibacillus intestini]|nr:hypothetical protein [Paenibacillus intestini]
METLRSKIYSRSICFYYNNHGDVIELRISARIKLNSYEYELWRNLVSEQEEKIVY